MKDWQAWMLEARDIYPQVCAGWMPYEEALLTATREVEDGLARTPPTPPKFQAPFASHAAEVRHVLVAVKLICHGVNPYDPALSKDEWIAVANPEIARFPWACAHAILWALALGYVAGNEYGGYRLAKAAPPRPILTGSPLTEQ